MTSEFDMLRYEEYYHQQGYPVVCGVDEAGRGPLAGPVCAAAVIFPDGLVLEEVNDSKKLTEKKREKLFDIICEQALAFHIAWASVEEIEQMNILNAAMLAMKRAVEGLSVEPDFVIVDGNKRPPVELPCEAIVKGDALSQSIAAASILAKVSRDRLMLQLAEQYPQYCFEKHKGYGTKLHQEKILEFGPCALHRPSFLKKLLHPQPKPKTAARLRGERGEEDALRLLRNKGFKPVARNYRSPYGEIDLIVQNDAYIVFAEVKARDIHSPARPSQAVGTAKQKKILQTAEVFLSEHPTERQPRFDVVEIIYCDGQFAPFTEHIENAFGALPED